MYSGPVVRLLLSTIVLLPSTHSRDGCATPFLASDAFARNGPARRSTSEPRVALISELTGAASVRKNSSSAASTVERFSALADGTILELGRDSRAVLVLARGKRFALGSLARATVHFDRLASTSGTIEELPSLPALPKLVPLDSHAPKALGGVRLRSTVIGGLAPANGSALAAGTTLRFTPVQGAATYRVEIEDETGQVVFGVQSTSTEVPVPPDILRGGTSYFWTVRTIDRLAGEARGTAAFVTLANDEAKAREGLKARLHQDRDASSLALLAAVDRQLGLYQEALDGFRAALARAPNDAALRKAVNELEAQRGTGG